MFFDFRLYNRNATSLIKSFCKFDGSSLVSLMSRRLEASLLLIITIRKVKRVFHLKRNFRRKIDNPPALRALKGKIDLFVLIGIYQIFNISMNLETQYDAVDNNNSIS